MPELILPCPNKSCHGSRPFALKEYTHGFCCDYAHAVRCPSCGMQGPWKRDSAKDAIAAWNALPRALRWTHEPPRVAGWYWVRISDARYLPKIVQITAKDIEMMSAEHALLKGNREWAGPIPAPVK